MNDIDFQLLVNKSKVRSAASTTKCDTNPIHRVLSEHTEKIYANRENISPDAYAKFLKDHLQKGLEFFLSQEK